ncbi:MAG: protein kinase [Actinomycetales bacterium]|nr:MAG: protein kinase [Actinomycetales bacterium]
MNRRDASGEDVARAALAGRRADIARLISLMEDRRASAANRRDDAIAILERHALDHGHRCAVLGITGTPGAGKSSLMAVVTPRLLAMDPRLRVAVVAIDPSSPTSGGSLLGDRTRMRSSPDEHRVYFRSQATVTSLGGMAPATYEVCRALATVFDLILVETVGVGQSEADIRCLADHVYLVLGPAGGDDVQLLKAGIIEIPDSFILNKADAPGAAKAYHQLQASLWLARPFDGDDIEIRHTSALRGDGIDELASSMLDRARVTASVGGVADRAGYFLARWVREEWGRVGNAHLRDVLGGPDRLLADHVGFGRAQVAFDSDIRRSLTVVTS